GPAAEAGRGGADRGRGPGAAEAGRDQADRGEVNAGQSPRMAIRGPSPFVTQIGSRVAHRVYGGSFPEGRMAPLRVLLTASEVVGFAKTGGLADVAGALPRALAKRGHQVAVVMP